MPIYKAPLRDMRFVLYELLAPIAWPSCPAMRKRRPTSSTRARRAASFCRGAAAAQPQRRRGGLPLRERRGAHARAASSEAYRRRSAEGGWTSLAADPDYGGQGLPQIARHVCVEEMICSANLSFGMYPGPHPAAPTSRSRCTARDELKQLYLPQLVDGTWSRHHVPDRAAMRHRSRPDPHQGRARRRRQPTRSPAPRSSSPPASTT